MMANSYDSERLRGDGLTEKDICDSRVAFTNENLITVYVNLINISVDTHQDYVRNRYNDHTARKVRSQIGTDPFGRIHFLRNSLKMFLVL